MSSGQSWAMELEWPFLLCVLEVFAFVVVSIWIIRKYESCGFSRRNDRHEIAHVIHDHLWLVRFEKVHPFWLLAFRGISFFYLLPLQIYNVVVAGPFVYFFYTEWTFTLLIIYFGLAMSYSMKKYITWKSRRLEIPEAQALVIDEGKLEEKCLGEHTTVDIGHPTNGAPELKMAGLLGYSMQVAFQICAPAVLLTDLVFWTILTPSRASAFHLSFVDVNMHAVNAIFLLGEFALNNMPFPWFRGAYFTLWSAAYVCFQWFLHAMGVKWWPYPFLEVSTPWAPLWYFGLACIHLLCFCCCMVLSRGKEALYRKCISHTLEQICP